MQKFDERLALLEPLSRLIPDVPILADFHVASLPVYRCPCCHFLLSREDQFCSHCGQAIDMTSLEKAPISFVLSVPRSDLEDVLRYCREGGQAPSCVAPSSIGAALEEALSLEVPGDV